MINLNINDKHIYIMYTHTSLCRVAIVVYFPEPVYVYCHMMYDYGLLNIFSLLFS